MTVAVHGLGVHMPPHIRTNDWWPAEIVDRWMAGRERRAQQAPPQDLTAGQQLVLQAMADYADDPFNGSEQRHVLATDQQPSDMQVLAAHDAMERADVGPADIDFVLEYSTCPDYLLNPNSCVVHNKLGLSSRCLTLSMHGECNAFMHQLHLSQRLLASGYRRGLLLQSSTLSRIVAREAPFSPWCGDGATAVIVGPPQREGQGLIADAHRTDSSLHTGLVAGVRGANFWTDEGRIESFIVDPAKAQVMLSMVADMGVEVVSDALARAGFTAGDVDFYASHQATPWFRRVTQHAIGLHNARAVDSFPWAGSLLASNLPLVLATAERSGELRRGDLVACYAGGSGVTFAGAIMRW